MNSIDVIFTPDLLPFADLTSKTVVVVDILRATTTITVALANGAHSITPVLTPEDAFRFADNQPDTLIGGERHGIKVDGFHLGNSPREYTQAVVAGKQVVLTTTNGTRTLQACRSAQEVFVGSFLNLRAVIDALSQEKTDLTFACAGREGGFCMEDTVFAGACVDALKSRVAPKLTDAAEAARLLYREYNDNLLNMLQNCYHGQYLASINLEADVAFCAQLDVVDIVPRQIGEEITLKRIET